MRAVASSATSEAEAFGGELREEHLALSSGWRTIITGTIDRYASNWGLERLTHQGRRFLRPVLEYRSPTVSNYRRDQYWAKKLIFKKLGLRLEAVVDGEGDYASMNTNFVMPGELDLYAVGALANSTLLSWIYEGYFGALRMSGGFMQAQAPQLRVLPMPKLPVVSEEGLEELVPMETPLAELCLPAAGSPDHSRRLYALLRRAGKAAHESALAVAQTKHDLAAGLLAALGATKLRDDDPSFVLPRQESILEASLSLDASDLSAFWTPMRRTARQMGVDVSPPVERALLGAVRAARDASREPLLELAVADELIDEVVFALYGLSPEQVATVRRGHAPPPGVVTEGEG
jgi:hypothetical protein